jgi:5-methylthioadenosine/S-adenosylhomocysteine deaminase
MKTTFQILLTILLVQAQTLAWVVGDGLILRGDVVTMDSQMTVIPNGRVLIRNQKIVDVLKPTDALPADFSAPPTVTIDTEGYILPGLIDLHNHVEFNALPLWRVPKLYANRYQWTGHKTYRPDITGPKTLLTEGKYLNWSAEVVKFAEVKAILGGATSIQGSPNSTATRFLVRNVENRNFNADRVFARALSINEKRWQQELTNGLLKQMDQGLVDAWIVHLAEGTDAKSRNEFATLKQLHLLRDSTVIVHGTALTSTEFQEMSQAGAKLVWSPLSNLLLYGKTTDIPTARNANVLVCLGSDWSPSGSKNLLGELKVAHEYDKAKWGHSLSDTNLVKMVTINPAVALGWDDKVGRIKTDYYADVAAFKKNKPDPYRNLIEAIERDVRLVLVDGVPYYGDRAFMNTLKGQDQELLMVQGVEKGLDITFPGVDKGSVTFAEIRDNLSRALMNDAEWLHHYFGGNLSAQQFRSYLDHEFPGIHAIALDLLLPDQGFFNAVRQNVNANLPYDLSLYWSQSSQPSGGNSDAALLALVNSSETNLQFLDVDVGLNTQAAKSIMNFRNGPDGIPNTTDDKQFTSIAQLDAVPYVGASTLNLLRSYVASHPH